MIQMITDKTLKDVQVGDEVLISSGWQREKIIAKVSNVTPRYLDAGGRRYRKDTGFSPGEYQYGGSHASLPDAGEMEKVREAQKRRELIGTISKADFTKLETTTLVHIHSLLK